MRLPVTDQFLFQTFRLTQKAGDLYDFVAPRTMKEAVYPELRQLRRALKKKNEWKNFSQLVYYLKRNGYIEIKNLQPKQAVVLTPKGASRILQIKRKTESRNRRKDRKWEMVIFDVPEERKHAREMLRERLLELDYQRLQDSVWVSPYDVFEETERFIREQNLDDCIRIFLIEEIDI